MEQLIEILEFFRNNNCEVEIYDCTYVTYYNKVK